MGFPYRREVEARQQHLRDFAHDSGQRVCDRRRLLLGAPLGILAAIYLVRFCPSRLYRVLKPAVALLAGIPSVVYGFFGLTAIVPL